MGRLEALRSLSSDERFVLAVVAAHTAAATLFVYGLVEPSYVDDSPFSLAVQYVLIAAGFAVCVAVGVLLHHPGALFLVLSPILIAIPAGNRCESSFLCWPPWEIMAFAVPAEAVGIGTGIAIFGFLRLWQGRRRRITTDGDVVDNPPLGANDDV